MLGFSSYMMCGNGYCSWKNHRHLGCHTTRKTSGKYPRVHCGCYVRLVMDSLAKCMKVCGTTQRKLPWKLSNLVSTYASSDSYCAILQSAVSFYVLCHFQWCSYSDSVHSALCECLHYGRHSLHACKWYCLLLHPFNGLFTRTTLVSWHQKGKPFWILLEQEMMGWQWHQLDYMLAPER